MLHGSDKNCIACHENKHALKKFGGNKKTENREESREREREKADKERERKRKIK